MISAARARLLEAADDVAAALVKIALDETQPVNVRVQAQRDLLDRAGLGATGKIDVTHRDLTPADSAARVRDELADRRIRNEQAATG